MRNDPNPKRDAELLKEGKVYSYLLENRSGRLKKRWGYVISVNDYNIWFWDELRYMENKEGKGRQFRLGVRLNKIQNIEDSNKEPRVPRKEAIKSAYEDTDLGRKSKEAEDD